MSNGPKVSIDLIHHLYQRIPNERTAFLVKSKPVFPYLASRFPQAGFPL